MGLGYENRRTRQLFEAQFEPAGDGTYLYRKNRRAPPIPVTRHERDRFVDQYVFGMRFVIAGMMAAGLGFLTLALWWMSKTGAHPPTIAIYGILTVLSGVIFMPLFYWIAGAPARELRGRAPVGPARTKDEMRAIYFKNISYGKIVAIALLGLSTPLARRNLWPENVAWHRWSWAIAIAILLVATVVAVRKFRFESAHRNSQA